jgi:hypothetical protein
VAGMHLCDYALPGSQTLYIAQAAHWFNWSKFWPECARVLRRNGSAAFWVHSLAVDVFRFVLTRLLPELFRISTHSLPLCHPAYQRVHPRI